MLKRVHISCLTVIEIKIKNFGNEILFNFLVTLGEEIWSVDLFLLIKKIYSLSFWYLPFLFNLSSLRVFFIKLNYKKLKL